ncbi:MAG: conjugal transfer protein TraX [Oscillospiraceae bacterium]|nr:conjugal transfer protein TraX [Oscillospiraceae bacterium]
MTKRRWWELTSAMLHILAMALMLSDHAWSTLFPAQRWMTSIGRIAFPIFAFLTAEGYFHTHDFKKYMKRMLIFALISEIPFNLMMGGSLLGPTHQNVIWAFLLALAGMRLLDAIKARYGKEKLWAAVLLSALVVLGCFLLGFAGFVDYYGTGVLMVLTFYFFRGRKWWCYLGQLLVMYYLNVELLGGYTILVPLLGHTFEIVEQGLALLALIPIWLYRGKQGHHSKPFQYFCYSFYPAHMLLLVLVGYLQYRLGG